MAYPLIRLKVRFLPETVLRFRPDGVPFRVQKRDDVFRVPDEYLHSVIYLYSSSEFAANGFREGASGFLVGVPSDVPNNVYLYAVTNRHVIENGCSVVRVNALKGGTSIFPFRPNDWKLSDSDDIAVIFIELSESEHHVGYIEPSLFLSEKHIADHGIGPGDSVFMMGRFRGHDGKLRNQPSVRTGIISMMPGEPIEQEDGHLQISYLVEAHSISGYSGSPVLVYLSKYFPRSTNPLLGLHEWNVFFLGVDWGHIPQWEMVLNGDGSKSAMKSKANTGMMGVVPASRLLRLFYDEDLVMHRKKMDEDLKESLLTAGEFDMERKGDPAEFTKADFEAALRKVSKKKKPKK